MFVAGINNLSSNSLLEALLYVLHDAIASQSAVKLFMDLWDQKK
jgi:aspartate oxidase